MDILGLNGGGSDSLYIKHSSKDKAWITADGEINLVHFLVDPTSIQTGWGMYDGMYNFNWDEKPGVKGVLPGPDYKRAFSVNIYIPDVGTRLWQRFTWGEGEGFNNMCSTFWNDIQKNPGKVPHLQYTGSRVQEFKVGSSSIPEFSFVKWTDKPADFNAAPVQPAPAEKPSGGFSFNDNSNTLDNQTPESGDPRFDPSAKPLTEDDLPF
tara:strand:+ start:2524 stop:3150 length:627 start_codon:yes stop_codon:yes gene_type:complete